MIHKNLREREEMEKAGGGMDQGSGMPPWAMNGAGVEDDMDMQGMQGAQDMGAMGELEQDERSVSANQGGSFELAHFNVDEIALMNELQGGEIINEELGLPEFFVLSEMLNNPEIIKHLHELFGMPIPGANEDEMQGMQVGRAEMGALDQGMRGKVVSMQPEQEMQSYEYEEYDNPEVERIADDGINGDTELAIIPKTLGNVLDQILISRGMQPQRNPIDGRRQYWAGALASLAAPFLMQNAGGIMQGVGNTARDAYNLLPSSIRGGFDSIMNSVPQPIRQGISNIPSAMSSTLGGMFGMGGGQQQQPEAIQQGGYGAQQMQQAPNMNFPSWAQNNAGASNSGYQDEDEDIYQNTNQNMNQGMYQGGY